MNANLSIILSGLTAAVLIFLFGVVAPALISATSDTAVGLGFAMLIGSGIGFAMLMRKLFLSSTNK